MASGKKKNPVTAYLNKVGIKKTNNLKQILTDKYGTDGANQLRVAFGSIEMKRAKEGDYLERYDFIHSDPEFSMMMSCFQDGEIIRNVCAWLNSIRDQIGKTVLDIGCGNGIITCFLASILPECTFMAIDRSFNGISVAKGLREKLGLSNIVFMHGDYKALEGKQYDTVLALRILDETCTFKDCRFFSFSEQLEERKSQYQQVACQIADFVAPGGNLISIERDKEDVSSLALLEIWRRMGLNLCKFQFFTCHEGDLKDLDTFTAIMTAKTGAQVPYARLFSQWSSMYFPGAGNEGYRNTEADFMLELCGSGNRKGYVSFHPVTKNQTGIFFLCDYKDRDDFFMLYQKNESMSRLGIYPITQRAEAEKLLSEDRQADRESGFVTRDYAE